MKYQLLRKSVLIFLVSILIGMFTLSCSSLRQPVRPVQKMHKKKRNCDCPEWSNHLNPMSILDEKEA